MIISGGLFHNGTEYLSPISFTLRYSISRTTPQMNVSFNLADGERFINEAVFPVTFIVDSTYLFSISGFTTKKTYERGAETLEAISTGFEDIRDATSITTNSPISSSINTGGTSYVLADAHDITPDDILTAGDIPPIVVETVTVTAIRNGSETSING